MSRICFGAVLSDGKYRNYRRGQQFDRQNHGNSHKNIQKKYSTGVRKDRLKKISGCEDSKGEYFLHLDADMILGENVVTECMKKIENDQEYYCSLYSGNRIGRKIFFQSQTFRTDHFMTGQQLMRSVS